MQAAVSSGVPGLRGLFAAPGITLRGHPGLPEADALAAEDWTDPGYWRDLGTDDTLASGPRPIMETAGRAAAARTSPVLLASGFFHLCLGLLLATGWSQRPVERMDELGAISVSIAMLGAADLDSTASEPLTDAGIRTPVTVPEARPEPDQHVAQPGAARMPPALGRDAREAALAPPLLLRDTGKGKDVPARPEDIASVETPAIPPGSALKPAETEPAATGTAFRRDDHRPDERTRPVERKTIDDTPEKPKPARAKPAKAKPVKERQAKVEPEPIVPAKAKPAKEKPLKARQTAAKDPGAEALDARQTKKSRKRTETRPDTRAGRTDGVVSTTGKPASTGKERARTIGTAEASTYLGTVNRTLKRAVRKARVKGRGTVLVAFTISASGAISGLRVLRSSGRPALDEAAIALVARAAPFPALPKELGKPAWPMKVPIEFKS